MIAGIVGDVVGSVYEGSQWQNKNLSLIKDDRDNDFIEPLLKNLSWVRKDQSWTDDTLCTLALCDAYMNNKDYADTLQYYCQKYGEESRGFGKAFKNWIIDKVPYNSYGNGSLMRIGFIQKLELSLYEKIYIGFKCTEISHNHMDSLNSVINYLKISHRIGKNQNKDYIDEYLKYNNITSTVESLHNEKTFDNSVKKTFEQVLVIVKESNSIEEVLINSCYVGGDVDTIACIACNLASELYPIPDNLIILAEKTLEPYPELYGIYEQYKENIYNT